MSILALHLWPLLAMTDTVKVALIMLCGSFITAAFSWSANRQSKANGQQLDVIHDKVNGGLDRRIAEVRRQAAPQILIVEDDENDMEMMRDALKPFGAEIYSARGPAETRFLIGQRIASGRGFPFDLALIDLKLSGGYGDEVATICDEFAPGVPIALITGWPDPSIVSRLAKNKPITILLKPLTEDMAEKLLVQYSIPFSRVRHK